MTLPSAPRHRVVNILARRVGEFAHQMPEQLPESVAELDALLTGVRAEINVYQARHANSEELTPEDVARLRTLISDRNAIAAAHAAAVSADTDHAAELADLLAQASEPEAAPAAEPEAAPEGAAGGTPDGGTDAPEGEPAPEAEPQPELITAGAPAGAGGGGGGAGLPAPSFAGAGAGGVPTPPAGETEGVPGWNLHPGAPGFRDGMGQVGFKDISLALEKIRPGSRASIRPNRPNRTLDGQEFARQVVSTLEREVSAVEDSHALVAAINVATDQRKLFNKKTGKGGSLVAAGGWCAPSEQLYDFCDVPDATDLVSLPEITINRGGIRWPREPDLSGIFEDFEWFFTEPELEATDPDTGLPTAIKTCVEIPCPEDFDEIRLNAVGWCVEAGILQEQGWPELVEWFMRNLTQEHLRALSRRTILNMVAGSGAPIVIPPTSVLGSVASVLNSLALMATNIRLKRGLARNTTIEGVAPSWFFEVLRADLAMRNGTDSFAITDAQITGWLSARNIALQFVGDWQTRGANLPGNLATLKWPLTVDVLLYPAGTWFRSMSNVIELGVMYPKEQLQVNRFTRMFTEDAIAVGKRCGESVVVRIPLDVSGATGIPLRRTNQAA